MSASEHGGGSETGTPYVSLKRTYMILLIVYGLGAVFALLAGAALTWHVDPYSECLLYSHPVGDRIEYGHEAICETIAYLYLGCVIGAITMFYITFKHRRQFLDFFNSGNFTKSEQLLTVNKPILQGHTVLTLVLVTLTLAVTAGYGVACNNISDKLTGQLRQKLNKDPNLLRGEKIDERFHDDNQFWRYTGEVRNPFGQDLYTVRMTCRTIFTDPNNHQELHDNHVKTFNNYYGYWFKEDLFAYDARYQAILQNGLIEATLAGGWISVLLWVGSIIFIIIQRTYIRREKNKFDRFSPHNNMMDSMRRGEGSMISGSGYYAGNMSNFARGGLRGSNQSMKSLRSRRDVDELAFASLGLPSHTGTMTSGYNSAQQTPFPDNNIPYPVGDVAQPLQLPVGGGQRSVMQGYPPVHYNSQQHYPSQQPGHTYLQDNMETEIM